jgi:hypothetical protein
MLMLASCDGTDDDPEDPDARELPSIVATVQTSGREIDYGVSVFLCGDSNIANCQAQFVPANGEATFPSLAPGNYSMFLRDLAENCSLTGEWLRSVPVQDSNVTVGFTILCRGPGTVRVSAVTSGTNQDRSYQVLHSRDCDDYYFPCSRKALLEPGTVEFVTWPGTQAFLLEDVAGNCAVVAPGNPATVTAIADEIVALRFEVACQ